MDAYSVSNWPYAFPLQVYWEVPVLHHDDWEVSVIWAVLRLSLLLFTRAEDLFVPLKAKDTLVDLLKELSHDGRQLATQLEDDFLPLWQWGEQ